MPARRPARRATAKDPRTLALDAATKLAAERGWLRVALADIATAAGLTLAEMQAEFPSKTALLVGILRRIDAEMLADLPDTEVGDSARDRLFGVIMRRLDVMRP